MGQALYRKYRSKNLGEIVGQEHITETLGKAIKGGHISHAYLLTGPRGVGKTSVARILAHEVNGLPYQEDSTHLDIIEIDAASNRRIDEIRELRDKVHVAPATAKYKVYIIDEVHMLTREAFNALLKTLEEPPAHAIFILATTEAYKLPETIISRTQRFTFRPIDQAKVIEHLKDIAKKEKINIDEAALEIIAGHGEGSFRDSISLLDQLRASGGEITAEAVLETLGEAPAEQIASLKNALASQSASQIVQALQSMLQNGYEPSRIAKQLGQSIRGDLLSTGELNQSTLDLLSGLLEVQKSNDPAVALELCLLKYASPKAITKPTTAPQAQAIKKPAEQKTDPKPKEEETKSQPKNDESKNEIEIEEKQPAPKKPGATAKKLPAKPNQYLDQPAELGDDVNEIWQKVMDTIKKQHNTLYSVIRMARPVWGDGGLKLSFGFSFHQKRINEPKNREIISNIITEITGHPINVTSVLDENMKPAVEPDEPAPIPSSAKTDDPVISNISNIFGGAELVES